MKIDVTGYSGFVGKSLVPYLQLDHYVTPVSLRGDWHKNLSRDSDAIIHLAGKAHDIHHISSTEEYFTVNTELTKQVFELFLNSAARDFIYFSSVKAVSDRIDAPLTENILPNPKTPYGHSKLKAEQFILSHQLPIDKRVIILRPCMIHGPSNKGNLNLLYKMIKKGIPYPLGSFDNKRSFLAINNLLFTVKNVLENFEIEGGIYNIADDETVSTNELIRIICFTAGIKPRILRLSPSLVKTLAKFGDSLHLPFNSEKLVKLTESYEVSNCKIKKAMGIDRLPLSSRTGLIDTIKSFLVD